MMDDRRASGQAAGLCERCRHVEVVRSSRGSTFYLCRLSFTDPRFARYPAIPVLACGGFRDNENVESAGDPLQNEGP